LAKQANKRERVSYRVAMNESPNQPRQETTRVPLFGTWRKAYLAVVLAFLLEVAFFFFVSRYFS